MMQAPVQIASRGLVLNPWWRDKIYRLIEKLNEFFDHITGCRVVVEVPHRHHYKGRLYKVRIDIAIPGRVIVIDREPDSSLSAAIDRAFAAAERRLEDGARLMHHEVKRHERAPEAWVARLFRDSGYGFLETLDGRQIYFHRNSVLGGGFDRLSAGSFVRFTEEQGVKGPQASTVRLARPDPGVRRASYRNAGRRTRGRRGFPVPS